MADILIKGLDLTEGACAINLTICSNGKVYGSQQVGDSMVRINTMAVELPEHGDLIERNALPIKGITDYKLEGHTVVEFEDVLNAPVIVEASNGN